MILYSGGLFNEDSLDIFSMKTSKQMISAIDTAAPKCGSASIVKIIRVLTACCINVISRLILKSEASTQRKMLLFLNELSSKTIAFNKQDVGNQQMINTSTESIIYLHTKMSLWHLQILFAMLRHAGMWLQNFWKEFFAKLEWVLFGDCKSDLSFSLTTFS